MAFRDEDYPGWKEMAESARRALVAFGYDVPQCLPGEPEGPACGGNFARHVMAYLAQLQARVDFEIDHLGPEAQPTVKEIYDQVLARLDDESQCKKEEHGHARGAVDAIIP